MKIVATNTYLYIIFESFFEFNTVNVSCHNILAFSKFKPEQDNQIYESQILKLNRQYLQNNHDELTTLVNSFFSVPIKMRQKLFNQIQSEYLFYFNSKTPTRFFAFTNSKLVLISHYYNSGNIGIDNFIKSIYLQNPNTQWMNIADLIFKRSRKRIISALYEHTEESLNTLIEVAMKRDRPAMTSAREYEAKMKYRNHGVYLNDDDEEEPFELEIPITIPEPTNKKAKLNPLKQPKKSKRKTTKTVRFKP